MHLHMCYVRTDFRIDAYRSGHLLHGELDPHGCSLHFEAPPSSS